MIKAVIFDLDNTLYSYDANHIYGMEALAGYCRETFGITEEETREYYRKAGYIMANRIGTDTACDPQPYAASAMYDGTAGKASFSACTEDVPYLLGCISSAYRTKSGSPGFPLWNSEKERYASESVQI